MDEIQARLFAMQDKAYRDFQAKLIPTVEKENVIGVRTPALRKYAKELAKQENASSFLHTLPHRYFDENQLHAFLLCECKDFDICVKEVCRFLPFVDNWATCDQMSPKVFKKHRSELIGYVKEWIASDQPYTVRFGVGMLMEHYLEEDFDIRYPQAVAAIRSQEYYVNMMRAWYFATALAKQYDAIFPFIGEHRLDGWTHNKAISKALESYRITQEQKAELKKQKVAR